MLAPDLRKIITKEEEKIEKRETHEKFRTELVQYGSHLNDKNDTNSSVVFELQQSRRGEGTLLSSVNVPEKRWERVENEKGLSVSTHMGQEKGIKKTFYFHFQSKSQFHAPLRIEKSGKVALFHPPILPRINLVRLE